MQGDHAFGWLDVRTDRAVARGVLDGREDAAADAPAANGSTHAWNGFTCAGTKEGAGSTWATAWSSSYVAYRCTYGDEQVAFTWGHDYSYP